MSNSKEKAPPNFHYISTNQQAFTRFQKTYGIQDINADLRFTKAFCSNPRFKTITRSPKKSYEERIGPDFFTKNANFNDSWQKTLNLLGLQEVSKIDDYFSHTDKILLLGNSLTEGKVLPIALDFTHDYSAKGIRKKLEWPHVYGKATTQASESEYGTIKICPDKNGRYCEKTFQTPIHLRPGLHIPGFTSIKYFKLPFSTIGASETQKGRIKILPRFVIGCGDLENRLSPKSASEIFLNEIIAQILYLSQFLENLPEELVKKLDPELLKTAKLQIKICRKYFLPIKPPKIHDTIGDIIISQSAIAFDPTNVDKVSEVAKGHLHHKH